MNYSIDQLSTVADCDIVLALAQKQKDDLEFNKSSRERNVERYAERSVQTGADLQAITGEISSIQTVIAGLPDGDVKDEMNARLKRLEYRQFLLEERSENYGLVQLLDRELDVGTAEAQLATVDDFIAQVEVHKATL